MYTHITLGKERKAVLNFFEKFDVTSDHSSNTRLRHPLTGLWLTQGHVFQSWLHTRNSKLWLSGIPGAGKTLLATAVLEDTLEVSSAGHVVAYFYCDCKDTEKQNPTSILGCIATQLARQNEQAFLLLQELYKKICHPEHRSPLYPKLPVLINTARAILSCFEDVSIVADGLDECGDNIQTAVESLMSLAAGEGSRTCLLILSRDIPEIRGLLEGEFSEMEVAAQSEDLRLYVSSELETRSRKVGRGQLRIRSAELKDHIMRTLVERSAGMLVSPSL